MVNNKDAMGKAFFINNNDDWDTTSWLDVVKDIPAED
jgi:hypothetical protein